MKRILHKLLKIIAIFNFFCVSGTAIHAQKLSGQWIGSFTSKSDPLDSQTEYVLEIEVNGTDINGYSYTYFPIAGKRYFVICKLKGLYEAGSKSLTVTETETIKSNTPPDFQNCLQSHHLTYFKQSTSEKLEGTWDPVEKESNCGSGLSVFERKKLIKIKPIQSAINTKQNQNELKKSNIRPSAVTKIHAVQKTKPIAQKEEQEKIQTKNPIVQPSEPVIAEKKKEEKIIPTIDARKINENYAIPKEKISNRTYQILKTINVQDDKIKIDLYDNGQIDGDTVSIYMNEKLIISKKMLTAKPISFELHLEDEIEIYDIIMYAENLGSIPPNTALMIVQNNNNRYEFNVTSTEQTSGAVRFKFKR